MSEPITITADDVLSTLAKMVAEHPAGYGYAERVAEITGTPWARYGSTGSCKNAIAATAPDAPEEKQEWRAACIVGEAITRLVPDLTPKAIGTTRDRRRANGRSLAYAGVTNLVLALRDGDIDGVPPVRLDPDAVEALRTAQASQDKGIPWAEAVRRARLAIGRA